MRYLISKRLLHCLFLLKLRLYQAVVLSNITAYFPQLNLETATFGVFSKLEKSPKTRMVQAGDRIEIYRPLLVDPKEARKARAAKVQDKN
jgi:putative ubiquitin-RnfH superfamily antitoxin RatB of RatAB toxin-antitoxin module